MKHSFIIIDDDPQSLAGVEGDMQVLDVACGTGNAALPAARVGADVMGLDLVPELLEAGRRKAEGEGLEIEWVEDSELVARNGVRKGAIS